MARATQEAVENTGGPASIVSAGPWSAREPLPLSAAGPNSGGSGGSRRRRSNGSGQRRKQAERPEPDPEPQPSAEAEAKPKPKRHRGSRGGRRHRRKTEAPAEPQAAISAPEQAPPAEPKRQRYRRGQKTTAAAPETPKPAAEAPSRRSRRRQAPAEPQPRERVPAVRPRSRVPVTGAPTGHVPAPFAHNAEYEFARILDFYGIDWQYEPRSFPLRWERGHVTEAFTPDFYLPDLNLYVELTTLKSGLTTEKNRKMRLLQQLYPEVKVILLKKRDYLRLLTKYGYGAIAPDQVPDIDRVLIPTTKLQQRVADLGNQISRDYAGKEPVLVGVLRGVLCFISDLMRQISLPTSVDLMSISSYEGNGAAAVRILKDLDINIKGRDVILVEDIVDTGMTLNHIVEYLHTKRPNSIKVCTLLDKRARRLIDVPLDYVGFEIADEFVVGYGLDFQQRFRNLPFIGVLKHELLP